MIPRRGRMQRATLCGKHRLTRARLPVMSNPYGGIWSLPLLSLSNHDERSGTAAVHKQDALLPSDYQQSLDAGTEPAPLAKSAVRYWSDFSRVYYHPKSSVQLYDYELDSSIRPFERFAMGTELFDSLDKEHDIIDRDWRPFVEECDLMQGIQVYTTLNDAWGSTLR